MSDSVRPHRRQPTRLPPPWDSPSKNTGVGCHCLQYMKVKSESEVAHSCPTQQPHGLQPTRLLCPWDFLGKSTGVGCHCLLQIFTYLIILLTSLIFTYLLSLTQKRKYNKEKLNKLPEVKRTSQKNIEVF